MSLIRTHDTVKSFVLKINSDLFQTKKEITAIATDFDSHLVV